MRLFETASAKYVRSETYNYTFNKISGTFARWGTSQSDDPQFSPYGPEIADIEISTVCHQGCSSCYKGLTPNGKNMSLETFQRLFEKLPKTVCQIAFGIGSIDANPDLFEIFNHCRENGVIPNVTINGFRMTSELFDKLAETVGACAVSHYDDDVCFRAVEELTNRGLNQVNIHQILAEHTYQDCLDLIDKATEDPRLKRLNAVVFLSLKPKGRGVGMSPVRSVAAFRALVDKAIEKKIGIGFDSCGCSAFLKAMKGHPKYDLFESLSDPCESGLFSSYFNVDGVFYPCSFCEQVEEGFNLLEDSVTFGDLWQGPYIEKWRTKLLKNCRNCPIYDLSLTD